MGWDAVGYQQDPMPTNVAVVAEQSARLQAVAGVIREQAARLRAAGSAPDWHSDAAERFRKAVEPLPGKLDTLAERYQKVGGALAEFGTVAAGTKAAAEQSRVDAEVAREDSQAAMRGLQAKAAWEEQARREAQTKSAANPGAPPVPPAPYTGPDWAGAKTQAEFRLQRAQNGAKDAVRRYNEAASHACSVIDGAIQDNMANDTSPFGWLKKGANWLAEHLPIEVISNLASTIAAGAALLTLFPLPGPWTAAFAIVAAAAAVVMVLCDVVQMLNKAYKEQPVTVWDFAGLAVDVLAAVPLVGGAISSSAKVLPRLAGAAARIDQFGRPLVAMERAAMAGGGVKNTLADMSANNKSLSDAFLQPGSMLWAGVGAAAGGGKLGGNKALNVINVADSDSRAGMALADGNDQVELEARARADASTFVPQAIPVPQGVVPPASPAPVRTSPFLRELIPPESPAHALAVPSFGPGETGARVQRLPVPTTTGRR
jgi:hypothetical protein